MRYLKRLERDLQAAAEAGILSSEQGARLARFVAERENRGRIRGVVWIGIFAGLCIAAGLSLIAAHNWHLLPAQLKMGGFLLTLAVVGWLSQKIESPAAAAVVLEVMWFFLPIVGIGLYAQIFQLSGDPVRPFLVWLALTLPLAWWSRHPAAAPIHAALAILVLFWGTMSLNGTLTLLKDYKMDDALPPMRNWALAAAVAAWTAFLGARRLRTSHQVVSSGALLTWFLFLMISRTPLQVKHEGVLFAAAVSLAVIWIIQSLYIGATDADCTLPRTAWIAAIYFMTFLWHYKKEFLPIGSIVGWGLAFGLAALAGAALALSPPGILSTDRAWESRAKAILGGSVAVAMVLLLGGLPVIHMASLAANGLLVAAGLGLMWHGSQRSSVAQINAGVGTLFLLLVTRFIDVFGSFLEGGVGFIAVGCVFAGIAYALQKSRAAMIDLAKKGAGA